MRKPLMIAAVAGAAVVITIGAISLNGERTGSVDPVAGTPQPAPDTRPMVINRPARLDADAPQTIPERAEDPRTAEARPEGRREGGRPDWRRRPGLNDEPMKAEDWASRFEEMKKRREDFMARFDADGDGELSEEERNAIREHFRAERRERMIARMTDRFDADGDGVLNEDERLAAEAELDAELEARDIERRARMVERFDTDGDGQLSDAENQTARDQFARDRGGRGGGPNGWREAVQRYDRDGDGELNLDESYDAYLDQFDQRTQREFTRRFDANADGGVDTGDFNTFLEKYNAKDEAADVNGDGKLDQRDVERFRDLMVASSP